MSSDNSTRIVRRRTADSKERFCFKIERVFNVTMTKCIPRKEIRRRIMLLILYYIFLSRALAFYFPFCIRSYFIFTSFPYSRFPSSTARWLSLSRCATARETWNQPTPITLTNFALGEVVVRHETGKRASERTDGRGTGKIRVSEERKSLVERHEVEGPTH